MTKAQKMAEAIAKKREEVKSILANADATADDMAKADALMAEIKTEDVEYKKAVERERFAADNDDELKALNAPLTTPPIPGPAPVNNPATAIETKSKPVLVIPGGMVTSLKNFKGQDAELKAYRFGQWFLSCVAGSMIPGGAERFAKNIQWTKDHTDFLKAQNERNNSEGGALVPQEFDRNIIDLRERYGVLRRFSKIVPMMSDTKLVPRRTGGLTAYFVTDNDGITESQKGWDNVELTAKKLATLTKYSSEVAEDAIINMGDDLAGEIAYAFSLKEDQCGFIGDGTSTYGKIVGIANRILNMSVTRANIASLAVALTGHNTWPELDLADFHAVVGKLPEYADTPNVRWFCHKTFYHTVMEKLMLAAGGVQSTEIRDGVRVFRFLGYEVVFTQVMPATSAADHVPALLGDLAMGSRFGDRRQTTVAIDTSLGFANDQWAIRGTERWDFNFHEPGNVDATAANQVPGPVIALATAAS
jgi:HK97 family phage major capsid protein